MIRRSLCRAVIRGALVRRQPARRWQSTSKPDEPLKEATKLDESDKLDEPSKEPSILGEPSKSDELPKGPFKPDEPSKEPSKDPDIATRLENLVDSLNEINKNSPFYHPVVINSDEDILQTFVRLCDLENITEVPPANENTLVVLRGTPGVRQMPDVPEDLDVAKLDKYVAQLGALDSRSTSKLRNSIDEAFSKILQSGLLRSVESFNIIIRFYIHIYKFVSVKKAFSVMYAAGIKPNVTTFNGVLSQLRYSKNRFSRDMFKMYLLQMKTYRIVPDATTWYIMFGFVKEKRQYLYDNMVRLGVPLQPITADLVPFWHKEKGLKVDQILAEIEKNHWPISKGILTALTKVYLNEDSPDKVFTLLDKHVHVDVDRPEYNTLIALVEYFAVRKLQIYNAVAVLNYFADHYDVTFRVYRCNAVLALSMTRFSGFKNWSVLTRRFYQDAMTGVHSTIMSLHDRRIIELAAAKRGISGFHIDQISKQEYTTTIDVFAHLNWKGSPIFEPKNNTPEFIEAVKFMIP